MYKAFTAILAAIFLTCAVVSVAEETVTPDPRLDQKVTYQAKGQLLYKVLGELTEKTHVKLTCGKNEKDWQVRDRKVSIFIKDMPLKDLQKTMAALLHFTWAKGVDKTDNQPTYRLFQDLKQRKEEAALRDNTAAEEAKKQAEQRKTALSELEKLDSLTPEEIEKLKTDEPFLYVLAKGDLGKGLSQMLKTMPDIGSAIADGKETSLQMSKMTPQAVEAARTTVQGYESLFKKLSRSGDTESRFSNVYDHMYDAKISVKNPPDGMGTDVMSRGMIGTLEINVEGEPTCHLPLIDPRSPIANVFGKVIMKLDQGMSIEQIGPAMQAEFKKVMTEQSKLENPDEKLPDDPALKKVINLEAPKQLTLANILEEFAKKSDLQLISDQFVNNRSQSISMTERAVGDILKDISAVYGKSVQMAGNLVVLQDKKWFIKRNWEIPDAWMTLWKEKSEKPGLGFDDMVAMACLTDDQINNTLRNDEVLGKFSWNMTTNRHILRLYAVLTDAQKKALVSPAGLDVSTLTDDQYPYFEYMLSKLDEDRVTQHPPTTLLMSNPEGSFEFRLASKQPIENGATTNDIVGIWRIDLPERPLKQEKKPETPTK